MQLDSASSVLAPSGNAGVPSGPSLAGAVLVAKLSMGALAWGDVWFGGLTRNPWNRNQGSSGSSAGSASATSAGLVAFSIGTAAGVLMAKIMNRMSSTPINPLIGAAGVSAVPMAARVVNKVGLESNHHNFLLMHAMGPNVAGVIGSAVAAGILLALVG